MKIQHSVLAIYSCVLLFAACVKTVDPVDENGGGNNNNSLSTVGQLLVDGKWQLKASTATAQYMGKDTTADLYADMDDCEKDDFIQFASDGTVTRDENLEKCPGNPQSATLTWKLMENDTKIAIYDNNPDTLDLEVSGTEMKFKQTKTNTSGMPVTYFDVYKNIK